MVILYHWFPIGEYLYQLIDRLSLVLSKQLLQAWSICTLNWGRKINWRSVHLIFDRTTIYEYYLSTHYERDFAAK